MTARDLICKALLGGVATYVVALVGYNAVGRSAQDAWFSHWAVVDNPSRDAWDLTKQVDDALALQRGHRVADVGAGSGYFSLRMARAVGPDGQVVATEVNPLSRWTVAFHAWQRNLKQISAHHAQESSVFPGADFDRLLMFNVFPFDACAPAHNKKLLSEVAQALRPGGRAVIVHDVLRGQGISDERACGDPRLADLVGALPQELRVVEQKQLDLDVPDRMEPGYLLVVERPDHTLVDAAVALPASPTKLRVQDLEVTAL